MKYGIYCSYWEKEWGGDALKYIPKVQKLGFDVLDVVFREDNLHARAEHIAVAINLFRKLVLQLLKHDKTLRGSMAGKREICAWRFDLALDLLRNADFS